MKIDFNLKPLAWVIPVAFACGPVATTAVAQGSPTEFNFSDTVEDICAFPVQAENKGKTKVIQLPGGGSVITAPGAIATLTNLADPTKQVSFGVTGSGHVTYLANGDVRYVLTGRSIVGGYVPDPYLLLVIGKYTLTLDAEGFQVEPLEGQGQTIDLCELLS